MTRRRVFDDEQAEEFAKIVAEGLVRGQGEFTDEEFATARKAVFEAMTAGLTAEMMAEGHLGIYVRDGVVKYKAVGDAPPE
jgi:hypothetical protein